MAHRNFLDQRRAKPSTHSLACPVPHVEKDRSVFAQTCRKVLSLGRKSEGGPTRSTRTRRCQCEHDVSASTASLRARCQSEHAVSPNTLGVASQKRSDSSPREAPGGRGRRAGRCDRAKRGHAHLRLARSHRTACRGVALRLRAASTAAICKLSGPGPPSLARPVPPAWRENRSRLIETHSLARPLPPAWQKNRSVRCFA
jgi:hypothetical protein